MYTKSKENKRLTRSTFLNQPDNSSTRKRSESTDSENVPPPPILPLETHFLITNVPPNSFTLTPTSLVPDTTTTFAHLLCPTPSNESSNESLQPIFRLLKEGELIPTKRSRLELQSDHSPLDTLSHSISRRHRGPEMLEKRMKRREKEKLVHERFKLQAHLCLLKNPSGSDWKTVRALALRRIKDEQSNGLSTTLVEERETEKVDRMRWIMVSEAEQTLKRYEKLLETRKLPKSKPLITHQASSLTPLPTPHKALQLSLSQSPPLPKRGRPPKTILVSDEHLPPKRSIPIPLKIKLYENKPVLVPEPEPQRSSLRVQQPVVPKTENQQTETKTISRIATPALSMRDSLYHSPSLRRTILEEGNRRRVVGRVSYAFGLKVPELTQIKWNSYGLRLESFALSQGLTHSPFKILDSAPKHQEIKLVKEMDEWVEFNPLLNEEKDLVERQDEYGEGSKFFELMDELDSVEEQREQEGEGISLRKLFLHRLKN
ncbi:hypothetical protein CROQUDRAFT_714833 [Cronartium quercuum f. sp. fusiforme G11]|uniref:Something about silencing protein 4 domain-containing protein n=1 Tax=Cronartium quercuum f. sp. fusiforme G11 TaxID=708437 RepID=A0A9P6TDJ3_9BASI|nr:hypothetical protein CROQUDRAFT_714833 [Cronartium quercuum f. sp. fusiforme G11]